MQQEGSRETLKRVSFRTHHVLTMYTAIRGRAPVLLIQLRNTPHAPRVTRLRTSPALVVGPGAPVEGPTPAILRRLWVSSTDLGLLPPAPGGGTRAADGLAPAVIAAAGPPAGSGGGLCACWGCEGARQGQLCAMIDKLHALLTVYVCCLAQTRRKVTCLEHDRAIHRRLPMLVAGRAAVVKVTASACTIGMTAPSGCSLLSQTIFVLREPHPPCRLRRRQWGWQRWGWQRPR